MRNGSPEDEGTTRRRARPAALAEGPHGAAAADGRDRIAGSQPERADAEPTATLGDLGDALLAAYRLAEQDGDALTVSLLGQALLRTGRRLARGMSPADVGIACH